MISPIPVRSGALNSLFIRAFTQAYRRLLPAAYCAALLLAGCASSGDVKDLDRENQVQDQRLAAIEETSGREISRMSEELKAMRRELRSTRGRLLNMSKKVDKLLAEQKVISEGQEKLAAQNRTALRKLKKSETANAEFRTRQRQEVDALRLSMTDLQNLMKTSLAKLPSKTKADVHFRDAFLSMVSGELDIAADRFRTFVKTYPGDERVPEAKYRGGQAYFLMRRYDHAIVPFFELVDKFGEHKLAVDARWMLARCLEETGDLKLARQFYAQLITENTIHQDDATRRVYFINELYPQSKSSLKKKKNPQGGRKKGADKSAAKTELKTKKNPAQPKPLISGKAKQAGKPGKAGKSVEKPKVQKNTPGKSEATGKAN